MKTTIEENYKKLLSLGFKYYDGRFALVEIEVYPDVSSKKKIEEVIWIGSFKELLIKNKKYGSKQ